MLESFKMEISHADFIRIVNAGVHALNIDHRLIEQGDSVVAVDFGRKRHTLVFESGRKLKVVDKPKAAPHPAIGSGNLEVSVSDQPLQNERV